MSAMTYRPGVYSSYTVTPSYTGAREALPVGIVGRLGLDGDQPVLIRRGDTLTGGTLAATAARLLFGAGLQEFWACPVAEGADAAAHAAYLKSDAAAYTAALEALGEAGEVALIAIEDSAADTLTAAAVFAEARSQAQRETLVFAGCAGNVTTAAQLAKGVDHPRVVLCHGAAVPSGESQGAAFWGAVALAAAVAVLEDPGISLTGAELPGLTKVTGATYAQVEGLLAAGVTPLYPSGAGVEAVRVLTTSTTQDGSPNRSFSPINSVLIIDYVMKALRRSLAALLKGARSSRQTLSAVASQITVLLGEFADRGIITGYQAPRVYCLADAPEVCVAEVAFTAAYLINQIHIRAQIQL